MKYWMAIVLMLGLMACDKESGDLPAYMRVPEVDLSVRPGEGAPSHKITDLWIYLDDEFHGAYPVGSDIPVLEEGPTNIVVFPGIKMNGVNASPDIYNMYAPYRASVDFKKLEKVEFPITFEYKENALFVFQEDFEQPHKINVDLDNFDTTRIVRTAEDVKWGSRAGMIELTKQAPLFKAGSDVIFNDLNDPNRRVFLELDYKNDEPIYIGFRGNRNGLAPQNLLDAIINPRDDWNKIYFEFTRFIRGTNWDYYQLLIETGWSPKEDTTIVSRVYLDNIKLTYLAP